MPGQNPAIPMQQPPVSMMDKTQMEAFKVQQLIAVSKESPYPSQREWALLALTGMNPQKHPQIVNFLADLARNDPAASVRAGSVRCLAQLGVPTNEVVATLFALRNDSDANVRQEVAQALARMNGEQNPGVESQAVQPTRK
jgi:HEAT repeat protein